MKKLSLAVVGALSLASGAHAQSSVTLYGLLDEGLNFNSNAGGHRQYNMSAGVLQGSRFGLRGAEDVGGGWKAIFTLENGFDPTSGKLGQGGLMFGRQAFVGLSSNTLGTVTFGRQYESIVDYIGQFEAGDQWGGYISAHPGDVDNFNNVYRTNNTIKYRSADFSGLTFGGTYSLGGVAGNFAQNQIWTLGTVYTNGPLSVAAAYLNARTPSNAGGLFGNNTTSTTAAVVTTPVYSGYTSANSYQVIGTGGSYTIGAATIGLTYSNTKFMQIGSNGTSSFRSGQTATFNNAEANFKYQITPVLLVGASFNYTHGGSVTEKSGLTNDGAEYYQGSIGADYFLSKRTDLYVIGVYQKASGTDSTNKQAVAAIDQLIPSSSDRQTEVRIGIRHKF